MKLPKRNVGWWIDKITINKTKEELVAEPKQQSYDCPHINLHHSRVEGSRTVCLDCRTSVRIYVDSVFNFQKHLIN